MLVAGCGDDDSGINSNNRNSNSNATVCGNGVEETGEQCDDGAANSDSIANACRTDCRLAYCGDGIVDSGESCDDANNVNEDGCLTACDGAEDCCVENTCGDGYVNPTPHTDGDPTEVCDDGINNGQPCRADCRQDLRDCGDGILDPGEECDNAGSNSDSVADACRTQCKVAGCGDDILDTGEVCDDGAANSDTQADACRTTCSPATCGDAVMDTSESCDGTDFGSADCTDLGFVNAAGYLCSAGCAVDSSGCTGVCGNAVLEPDEQCDDGGANSDTVMDACRTDCATAHCGDGVKDTGESCDGADLGGWDCTDLGYAVVGTLACLGSCSFNVTGCGAVCGNGVTEPGEQCDDGGANSDTQPDACRTDCTDPRCGDGVADTAEACDGADLGGQDCVDHGYTNDAGLTCIGGCQFDTGGCSAVCGNGDLEPTEICDDSDTDSGDGCSSSCAVETRWQCTGEPSTCVCVDYRYGAACAGCRVFVDNNSGITLRDGKTWGTALADVQAAIDLADGLATTCEVWVAGGTYYVYQSAITDVITMREGVDLYGGFVGTETTITARDWVANPTVLDGHDFGGTNQVVYVVHGANNTRLDGFVVTGGAPATGFVSSGGMQINSGSSTVANCTFIDNTAASSGGAMAIAGATVTIENTWFEGNSADDGGALSSISSSLQLIGCTFVGNNAWGNGGALLVQDGSLVASQCILVENSAGYSGGGAHDVANNSTWSDSVFAGNQAANDAGGGLFSSSFTKNVQRCIFSGNRSQSGGGLQATNSSILISDSFVTGNSATSSGGGIQFAQRLSGGQSAVNIVVAGNSSDFDGGGITVHFACPELRHCTVFQNYAAGFGGAIKSTSSQPTVLISSLLVGNTTGSVDPEISDEDADTLVSYCSSEETYSGTTNFTPACTTAVTPGSTGSWTGVSYDAATLQTAFTDSAAGWAQPGALAGLYVQPDSNEVPWLYIVDNTATAIFVWGDMTAMASAGTSYLLTDLHLSSSSTCLNSGDPVGAPTTDIEGTVRTGIPDISAYEFP